MDLSGHSKFRERFAEERNPGLSLLANGWAALAGGGIERLEIHLRGGQVVSAIEIRIDGNVAETSAVPGSWTHAFAVENVMLIRKVLRGGL